MDNLQPIAIALGAAWASGLNLYATVLMLGILGATGTITLPVQLETLTNPWVIGIAGFMYAVEFFADKIPAVDSIWDALHTFIRIPAGAVLAAAAVGPIDPVVQTMALLLGGVISAASHGTKMSARLSINASPEPFSNWAASISEDIGVFGGLYFALWHPIVFLCFLLVFVAIAAWLLPKLLRAIWGGISRLAALIR